MVVGRSIVGYDHVYAIIAFEAVANEPKKSSVHQIPGLVEVQIPGTGLDSATFSTVQENTLFASNVR